MQKVFVFPCNSQVYGACGGEGQVCGRRVEVRGRCAGACGGGGGSAPGSSHVGCKETGGSWGGAEASQEGPWFLGSHVEAINGEREGIRKHIRSHKGRGQEQHQASIVRTK